MEKLPIFVTGNAGKAKELERYLKIPLAHQKLDLVEIQSLNLKEVVDYKAKEAYRILKVPVLVEDTSLQFLALGNLPGTLIKWFFDELGSEGLCHLLDGYEDRRAIAKVCFGLYDGRQLTQFAGAMSGSIAASPKGEHNLGWDPIFIPKGYHKTWGEMTEEQKDATSMRAIALSKLRAFLAKKVAIEE